MSDTTLLTFNAFTCSKGLSKSSKLTKISPPSSRISKQPFLGFSGLITMLTPETAFSRAFLTWAALFLNKPLATQCSMINVFAPEDGPSAAVLGFFVLRGSGSEKAAFTVGASPRTAPLRVDLETVRAALRVILVRLEGSPASLPKSDLLKLECEKAKTRFSRCRLGTTIFGRPVPVFPRVSAVGIWARGPTSGSENVEPGTVIMKLILFIPIQKKNYRLKSK
ncbi:GGDEF domain protein [Striga asiatica]|uniref:GGDEF domain protein n=1 Tax=Striga asiatica TaxID=4170 RepID=A0A5A7PCG3_STRAF|nr:GGDEF domain protein [Striga asiatica]